MSVNKGFEHDILTSTERESPLFCVAVIQSDLVQYRKVGKRILNEYRQATESFQDGQGKNGKIDNDKRETENHGDIS